MYDPPEAWTPTSPQYQEVISISSDEEEEAPGVEDLRRAWKDAMAHRQQLLAQLDSNLEYLDMLTKYAVNYFPEIDLLNE